MVKKILALMLVLMLAFSVPSFAATFTDVNEDGSKASEAIGVLSELGVLSGMGDGLFLPDESLTRAQFAKIAVCIMGKLDEAVVTTDAFSDVNYSHWYSGYVNVVAKEGVITGYPDGSFGANDPITYAQAITVVIRLLGYNASDVGHKWPQGYVDKARVLCLTEGMEFDVDDSISRKDAALIIYRALFTDIKNEKSNLVTRMDKNVYSDAVLMATSAQNTALISNQLQTDKGTFTYDATKLDAKKYLGYEGTLVVNDTNEVICFVPDSDIKKEEYTISAVFGQTGTGEVSVITENNTRLTLSDKAIVYLNGSIVSADTLSSGVNGGSSISVFKEKGTMKYAFVDEYRYEGPKTVLSVSAVERMFDVESRESLKVVRGGVTVEKEDIELYDVLYYSRRTNTIYAYNDRVTGMYAEAYPMKSNVTRVTVSGTEYVLSTMEAVNKLNESEGAFKIGDRVTLLLGENGDVVDVVRLTDKDLSMYGVVLGGVSEISSDADKKGRTEHYVNIMMANGKEVKLLAKNDDYFDKAGQFCSVDFEGDYASLTFSAPNVKTGEVDKDEKTLGEESFAPTYAILDYCDGNETKAVVAKISINDIDGIKLAKKDVKHVEKNTKGEITVLYLNNVSGYGKAYGIITSVPENSKSGVFTLVSGDKKYSESGQYNSLKKGDAVSYYKGISESYIVSLPTVAKGTRVDKRVDNVLVMNGQSYLVSDDVTVYAGQTISDIKTISIEDVTDWAGTVTFHSDRDLKGGGKVKVIRIYGTN